MGQSVSFESLLLYHKSPFYAMVLGIWTNALSVSCKCECSTSQSCLWRTMLGQDVRPGFLLSSQVFFSCQLLLEKKC